MLEQWLNHGCSIGLARPTLELGAAGALGAFAASSVPYIAKSRPRTSASASTAPASATTAPTIRILFERSGESAVDRERRLGVCRRGHPSDHRCAPPAATAWAIWVTWPAMGVPTSPERAGSESSLWKIAPSAAIPVAMPTWRKVELIPDAIPLRCGGTTPIAAEASDGLTNPMPAPATMNPGSSAVQCECALEVAYQQQADADQRESNAQEQADGHARGQVARDAATTNISSVVGRKRSPV